MLNLSPPFPRTLLPRMTVCLSWLPRLNVILGLTSLRVSGGCFHGVSDREKVFLLVEMAKTLDVVDSAIDPKEFFTKYVQTRTPVVIKGLIRDEEFQASRWVRAPSSVSSPSEANPNVWNSRQIWNTSPKRLVT